MVGSLFRPFGDGHQTRARTSLEAAAVLGVAAGVPKIRAKAQSDGSGDVGIGVVRLTALEPVDHAARIEFVDAVRTPRGGPRFRIPARAPPFS